MTRAFDQDKLQEYYGKILQGTKDLKTNACCCDEALSAMMKAALAEINDEVLERFYGCGSPLPPLVEDCTILDLGCGAGRDAYLASRLVGPGGYVIGVDTRIAPIFSIWMITIIFWPASPCWCAVIPPPCFRRPVLHRILPLVAIEPGISGPSTALPVL